MSSELAEEAAAPGIAAMLEGVSADGSHAVLDLGPAASESLTFYSRYARRVRFVDLLGEEIVPRAASREDALVGAVPAQPDRPYDLVFAWDSLDRLFTEDRRRLVDHLAELTTPGARLHIVVHGGGDDRALRFMVPAGDRMRYEPADGVPLAAPRILPADVVRLLAPFRVAHAFTLRSGRREYVAVKTDGG